jgi:hypothetical protein
VKHGRKEILGLHSNQIVKRRRKLRKKLLRRRLWKLWRREGREEQGNTAERRKA